MRRRVSSWTGQSLPLQCSSAPSAIGLPSRAERTIHPLPVDCARGIGFSTGSYSVVRCDLLRLNPGVTETVGCFTGRHSAHNPLQQKTKKKRDNRLASPLISDLRQKTPKENSQ